MSCAPAHYDNLTLRDEFTQTALMILKWRCAKFKSAKVLVAEELNCRTVLKRNGGHYCDRPNRKCSQAE